MDQLDRLDVASPDYIPQVFGPKSEVLPRDDGCPSVLFGTPVRDMAWVLPKYLQSVEELDYPKKKMHLRFIENNSLDGTWRILNEWVFNHSRDYASVDLESRIIDGLPTNKRHEWNRRRTAGPLAKMRRDLFEEAIRLDVDFLALVDADILLLPQFLRRLIGHQKDVVAGLVNNSAVNWDDAFQFNFLDYNEREMRFERRNPPGLRFTGIRKVALTGAAVVISKKAFTLCRPKEIGVCTDEGFARCLKSHKIESWVDTDCPCYHQFDRPEVI